MYRILIPDHSFRELNIPLLPAQYRDLEKRIRKGLSVEPIPVWNTCVLTGYERYELSEKYHRNYLVNDMHFSRRHEAFAWICRQQLERKDLHRQAVCWLIYRLYRALLEAERQKTAKDLFQYRQLSPSFRSGNSEASDTFNYALLRAVGKEYGYHESTVRNYVLYGKRLDQLEEIFPGIRLRILKGEIEVPIMFMDAVAQMPKEQLGAMISNPLCRKLLPPEDVQMKIRLSRESKKRIMSRVQMNMGIKETPVYDPDAELNQLTYTIGTWSRAINRTRENADFQKATETGRENLFRALRSLAIDMKNLSDKLEAQGNE